MQYRTSVLKTGSGLSPLPYDKAHILSSYYTLERRRINEIKGYHVLFPDPGPGEECLFNSVTMKEIKVQIRNDDKILDLFLSSASMEVFGGHLGIVLDEDFKIRGLSYDGCSKYTEGNIISRISRRAIVYDAFARVGDSWAPYELYQEWEINNMRIAELCIFGNVTNLLGFWCNAETVWNRVKHCAVKAKAPVIDGIIKDLAKSIFGDYYLKLSPRKAMIYDPDNIQESAFHKLDSWDKLEQLFILNFLLYLVTDYSNSSINDLLFKEYLYGITMLDLIRKHVEVSDPIISTDFTEGHWGAFKFIQQKLLNS